MGSSQRSLSIYLGTFLLCLVAVSTASQSSDEYADIIRMVESCISQDDYAEAKNLLNQAAAAAGRRRDAAATAEVQLTRKRLNSLQRIYNSIRKERETLEQSPDNREANTAVGSFYCFAKNEWDRGLPLLRAGEGDLAKAAALDLTDPMKLADQHRLGELWLAAADSVRDRNDRERIHLRARRWLLSALQRAETDEQRRALHAQLDKVELYPSRLVLWNTHNGGHNDRGTLRCVLVLMQGDKRVYEKELRLRWSQDESASNAIDLPRTQFDQAQIKVLEWHGLGGGLAEVEVYDGSSNLALNALATGDSTPDADFRPEKLTDGNRGDKLDQTGLWLLSNGTRGTVTIHLNRR